MPVITGAPGEVWTNDLDKAQWQFHVNWANSCGLCAQFDGQIARFWPIPMHRGCRCKSSVVFPGQQAQPFTDYREKVASLDSIQQSRVMGTGNYRLVESGAVKWEDVVTQGRIRTLTEVMARGRITVDSAVKAGVNRIHAQRSFDYGHSAATESARRQARTIAESLKAHGLSVDEVLRLTGEKLAERVGIGGKTSSGLIMMAKPVVAMNRRVISLLAARDGLDIGRARAGARQVPEAEAKRRTAEALGEEIASRVDLSGLSEADLVLAIRRIRNATDPEALAEVLRHYRAKPPQSKASVSIPRGENPKTVEARIESIFGKKIDLEKFASLVGAPDDTQVLVGEIGVKLDLRVLGEGIRRIERSIGKVNGKIVMYNEAMILEKTGTGLGMRIFMDQVENAAAMGVDRIKTIAARDQGMNGYYTWARFGYDAPIPADAPNRPKSLEKAERVSDLMSTPEGRAWWKENGVSTRMEFDLSEGSYSRQTLERYRAEKKAEKK